MFACKIVQAHCLVVIDVSKLINNNTKSKNNIIMAATRITVNSNGSLKVEGDFEIVDKNGNVYDLGGRTTVSICRCGLSSNKPFCDASHKGHFEHEAIAFALPPKKT